MNPSKELQQTAIASMENAAIAAAYGTDREKNIILARIHIEENPYEDLEGTMSEYWQDLVLQGHLKLVTLDMNEEVHFEIVPGTDSELEKNVMTKFY